MSIFAFTLHGNSLLMPCVLNAFVQATWLGKKRWQEYFAFDLPTIEGLLKWGFCWLALAAGAGFLTHLHFAPANPSSADALSLSNQAVNLVDHEN